MSADQSPMMLRESATRQVLIHPLLLAAGWKLDDRTHVRFEVPVDDYETGGDEGITDCTFFDFAGNVLSVLECKRFRRNARDGQEQLRLYLEAIAKRQGFMPFGFMSNGQTIYFWDYGFAHPRMVAGFFTREDLDRLLFLRQHRQPLEAAPINTAIVNRPYQHEAVRRIAEKFAKGERRALLVMASGTGKTFSYAETVASNMREVFRVSRSNRHRAKALENAVNGAILANRFAAMDVCQAMIYSVDNEELGILVANIINDHRAPFMESMEPSFCKSDLVKKAIRAINQKTE